MMKTQTLRQLPPRWKLGGLTLVLLLIAWYALHGYLTSPWRVVQRTFAALDRRDAYALVSLASEKERRLLNLTPQTVEACLRETWWRNSGVKPTVEVKSSQYDYADILACYTGVTGFSPDGKARYFNLIVYQDTSGRWCLALSFLLYMTPKVCNGVEGYHSPIWDDLARRVGIRGVVEPDGSTRWADGSVLPKVYLTRK